MKTPKLITYFICIVFSLIFVFPIYWAFISSFKPNDIIFSQLAPFSLMTLLPRPFSLESYAKIFHNSLFVKSLLNTMYVGVLIVFLGLLINAISGYIFATERIPLKKLLLSLVVFSSLVPADLLTIPSYNMIDSLGWIDTKYALIIPAIANGIVILMFYLFFLQIPKALTEAALIDGASKLRIFFIIFLPLSIPTLIGGSLMIFIIQWEQFLWPLLVSRSEENMMIQVAITSFKEEHGTLWNQQFAAATIALLIPLGILMPLQKYYVSSVVSSAIK